MTSVQGNCYGARSLGASAARPVRLTFGGPLNQNGTSAGARELQWHRRISMCRYKVKKPQISGNRMSRHLHNLSSADASYHLFSVSESKASSPSNNISFNMITYSLRQNMPDSFDRSPNITSIIRPFFGRILCVRRLKSYGRRWKLVNSAVAAADNRLRRFFWSVDESLLGCEGNAFVCLLCTESLYVRIFLRAVCSWSL